MMDIEDILRARLTEPQQRAAVDLTHEVLTLACAGSGKSRTLGFRIAWLVATGAAPDSIVAFTFTEKAADAIALRAAKALRTAGLDPNVLGAMYIGTIHAYCQMVLGDMDARYRQFEVLDDNRLKLFLMSRWPDVGMHVFRGTRRPQPRYFDMVRQVSRAWAMMNDEMIEPDAVTDADGDLGALLGRISAVLDEQEFIDFSLMIRLVVDALAGRDAGAEAAVAGLRHLLVDEYQDVNPAQEALIRELHARSETLFVAGDDDQALYSWRGADVSNILQFDRRWPDSSVHTLSHNFRSIPAIVSTADAFAAAELGAQRMVKNPTADEPPPAPRDFRVLWFSDRPAEAGWVAERIQMLLGTAYREKEDGIVRGLTPGDFAVLMRSTRVSEQAGVPRHSAFTDALTAHGIDYTLETGGGIFDRPEVRSLRDTFYLLRSGSPDRDTARAHFDQWILPAFPHADFDRLAAVLADWGRRIHDPIEGARRRVYPQELVHELLAAFGIAETDFDEGTMRALGLFSRIMEDVEAVYMSIDSRQRFASILNFLQNIAESGYDTATGEVLRRPDLVTVSTVHRAKGLEFPVVFIVDVEAQRFPRNRRRYDGWLPASVIDQALDRGAYQSTRAEEARLFYTALTRGERFLYVTGAERLPGGRKSWRVSPFAARLAHAEISNDPDGVPGDLESSEPSRRIDETVMPTTFSEIRYYLRCPADYRFRKTYGFSPPITEMFGFGQTVHAGVGRLHQRFPDQPPSPDEARRIGEEIFHLKHVPPSRSGEPGPYERARDSAGEILANYARDYEEDFTRRRQVELRFEVPIERGIISGSIDLLLREDESGNILDASVIDFKTMRDDGDLPVEDRELDWTELVLQVQLYALGAREAYGENARTGAVHLLKDGRRFDVPVTEEAIAAAVANVEWAVGRILSGEFPMRPAEQKCADCDFHALCPKKPQEFNADELPPAIHLTADDARMARAFSEFEQS